MKRVSKYNEFITLYVVLLLLLVLNTVFAFFVNLTMCLVSALITLIGVIITIVRFLSFNTSFKELMSALEEGASINSKSLAEFGLPSIIASENNEIIWYNNSFSKLTKNTECFGSDISELLHADLLKLESNAVCEAKFGGREYDLFRTYVPSKKENYYIYYLVDNTSLKRATREYYATRPVVMVITTDNFNEALRESKDSERSAFLGAIHGEIEKWLSEINSVSINIGAGTIHVILDERGLKKLSDTKFSILEAIRKLKLCNFCGVTLSIGIGRMGATYSETEILSKQALDMAQSRGGDQVVIKNSNNEYKFFGGISSAKEQRTKVRARTVASAILEMINASSKVVLMGHQYSDLDCFGASYALASVSADLGKQAYVVFDKEKTLALPLYNYVSGNDERVNFVNGTSLFDIVDEKTLLIISDTHRADFLECPDLYDLIKNVIVIDHHRKAVDAIDNAVIFYHATAASSACEMVTELIEYMPRVKISETSANALLSGITLDTKNFFLHTGVRTFEAASKLRAAGADTILVKRMSSDNMRTYSRKSLIVSRAELYQECAIAYDSEMDDVTRIAASQSADEMLYLEGVKASFVLYKTEKSVNISSRSYGEVNVQLIMESLGGGGHQNMAACQLDAEDIDTAKQMLIKAIDNYNT